MDDFLNHSLSVMLIAACVYSLVGVLFFRI